MFISMQLLSLFLFCFSLYVTSIHILIKSAKKVYIFSELKGKNPLAKLPV